MKFAALISGGKDSIYSIHQCIAQGHELVALAHLSPIEKDELDSFMYQTVGHMGIWAVAESIGVPLYDKKIEGGSVVQSMEYSITSEDEVEDLFLLLSKIKTELKIEAVSSGAVLSNYQRIRVENVCERLGLVSLSYLWERNQNDLLLEMIDSGMDSMIIKVAAVGLYPKKHLGKSIKEMQPILKSLEKKFDLHVCGEGGEYETFTLDCPIYRKKIIVETELIECSEDVGYLNFKSVKLQDKNISSTTTLLNLVQNCGLKTSKYYMKNNMENLFSEEQLHTPTLCLEQDEISNVKKSKLLQSVHSYSDTVEKAMNDIYEKLISHGRTSKDIITVKMFVDDMKKCGTYNSDYIRFFCDNIVSRTCVQVELKKEANILIEVLFNNGHDVNCDQKKILHVQSVSHWAPANIGPYCQVVQIGDVSFIAGIIGLIPSEMILAPENEQADVSILNLHQVLAAHTIKQGLHNVIQVVCYVTHSKYITDAKRIADKFSLMVSYVVVPALPKGAVIEWQTWTHKRYQYFKYTENSFDFNDVKLRLRKKYIDDSHEYAFIADIYNYRKCNTSIFNDMWNHLCPYISTASQITIFCNTFIDEIIEICNVSNMEHICVIKCNSLEDEVNFSIVGLNL